MGEPLGAYMSAAEAMGVLTRAVGSRDVAISLLSDALRGGVVNARGWEGDDHMRRIRPVPAAVWRDATNQDRENWSWSGGVFGSSHKHLLAIGSGRYEGVSFDTMNIVDLCERHGDPANLPSSTPTSTPEIKNFQPIQSIDRQSAPRGGNPGKVEIWHRFWLEAMTMLDEGALEDRERFPTQKSLMDELRHRIDDGLSEESVKPQVSRIWLKFVSREG